jgi:hypothetical protein
MDDFRTGGLLPAEGLQMGCARKREGRTKLIRDSAQISKLEQDKDVVYAQRNNESEGQQIC